MQEAYLDRLPNDLRAFVGDIERSGVAITVVVDGSRAGRDPGHPDPLACNIEAGGAEILIPEENHFPESAVLHELLHVRRFLIDCVPKVVICDEYWTPELEMVFVQLDNNIEHLVIVPEELQTRPQRRERWIRIMWRIAGDIRSGAIVGRDAEFLAIYTSTFNRLVLNDTEFESASTSMLGERGLSDRAARFHDAVVPALESKEAAVRECAAQFDLDERAICLEYLDPDTGLSREVPLVVRT